MAEFVLKNNYFEFDGKVYQQISGTAIGTKFAPPYACLFLDKVETDFLDKEVVKPWSWFRYIDDIFFVWTEGLEKLESFLQRLNCFHPNLKFTYEFSAKSINFLDVNVSIDGNTFVTDLYSKSTDCHQFLHYESAHPTHVKNSIVYSQGLRIKRLCTSEVALVSHLGRMRQWFCDRGYPGGVIDKQLARIYKSNEGKSNYAKKGGGTPLVVTFHPSLANLGFILRKNLNILYIDREVKNVFASPPFVSFRAARSLKNHLVRAKVRPMCRLKGSCKCGKRNCSVCDNLSESTEFACVVDGKKYKINHKLNCDDKCLIYLLTCKVCGIQYVGQTTDKFRYRWNNYKSCQRKASRGMEVPQMHLHKHFLSQNHNGLVNDVEIKLIDKTDGAEPTIREEYWINKLKTRLPKGLNF